MEVVFDIGNVLLRWNPRNLYRKLFDDERRMELFLAEALPMSFVLETDIAPSFSDAIAARARAFPDDAAAIEAFDTRWVETLGGPIDENVALLRRLKAGDARVHALSNFAHEKFAQSCAAHDFLTLFDVAVISGREGVAKPHRRIFEILVARTGRPPQDLLFVDDVAKNIAAARAFGIETIHYQPGVDLERELAERGLLS